MSLVALLIGRPNTPFLVKKKINSILLVRFRPECWFFLVNCANCRMFVPRWSVSPSAASIKHCLMYTVRLVTLFGSIILFITLVISSKVLSQLDYTSSSGLLLYSIVGVENALSAFPTPTTFCWPCIPVPITVLCRHATLWWLAIEHNRTIGVRLHIVSTFSYYLLSRVLGLLSHYTTRDWVVIDNCWLSSLLILRWAQPVGSMPIGWQ